MIQLAGAIIVNDQSELLLIHRSDERLNEWQIPGGKIELGESAADAAIRELHEELGLEIATDRSLGKASFIDPTIDQRFSYEWFRARIVAGEPTLREPVMFNDWRFVPLTAIAVLDAISPNVVNFLDRYPTVQTLNTVTPIQTWSVELGRSRINASWRRGGSR